MPTDSTKPSSYLDDGASCFADRRTTQVVTPQEQPRCLSQKRHVDAIPTNCVVLDLHPSAQDLAELLAEIAYLKGQGNASSTNKNKISTQ